MYYGPNVSVEWEIEKVWVITEIGQPHYHLIHELKTINCTPEPIH
jgi:hypothetical protein